MKRTILSIAIALAAFAAFAQQPLDEEYTNQIRQFTTGPTFMTELVDHLPASATVPSPLKVNGYIAGADGHLTYTAGVHAYMRALAASSPRVKVSSIGKSEEGREMIVVAISSEENLAKLDRYKEITRKLADPRAITDAEAKQLIAEGKPFYYATGAMHSPETGSPEMLMELAYRLAVEETPFIQAIRNDAIVLLTPVLEVDGHDRMVDLWQYRTANPGLPTPPLIYWGHYVAHDNNRDNIGLALNLSKNVLGAYFDFHPQVLHDLHESIPFLYISTGTGPFNPVLDPLVVDELHTMAYNEVGQMTRRGVPGVWTHGFYDGWTPNYMFWIGLGHNTIGRFYETFGNRWPTTENRVIRGMSDRAWFRPNPPLPQARWSFRNNINYQQSALLHALNDVARRRGHFLEQFWTLGKRSIAKAMAEGPSAYVFDGAQKRHGNLRELMTLLTKHGIEVHVSDEAFSVAPNWPPQLKPAEDKKDAKKNGAEEKDPNAPVTFARGSYVVRMDQPYSRMADALLDIQYVRGEERVYDDTGWTQGYLKNVDFARVVNPDVLKVKMHRWEPAARTAPAGILAVSNHGETDLARLRFTALSARVAVAEAEFKAGGKRLPAGTVLVSNASGAQFGLDATSLTSMPDVAMRELRVPRIALLHTWISTQEEGWYRLALESMGIPYTYISTQDVAQMPDLRSRFDVVLFPPVGTSPQAIVNGFPAGPPMPWKSSDLTPNLGGIDETDDIRPGLGLAGVQNLQRFVEDGGLLIAVRDTAAMLAHYGIARYVEVVPTTKLKAVGSIVRGSVIDAKSPVLAGYDATIPLYFDSAPVFKVGVRDIRPPDRRPSGRGSESDPDVPQGRAYVPPPVPPKPEKGEEGYQLPEDMPQYWVPHTPRPEDRARVLVSFAEKPDELLLSGMLEGGDELAGKPAVILAPLGKGNILLFANDPMWRMNTQGTFALVTNAMMRWDSLR
ncbi:MAG: M14 family zinc carboxypeptidase [Thermoanaerobaculia bacterium]